MIRGFSKMQNPRLVLKNQRNYGSIKTKSDILFYSMADRRLIQCYDFNPMMSGGMRLRVIF